MSDGNTTIRRRACLAYCIIVAAAGAAVGLLCVTRLVAGHAGYQWLILVYLTVLTGAFVLWIPGVNSKLSASDVLIFMNMVLFGSAAGALTAAVDGFLASLQFETPSRRRRGTPFNTASMVISGFAAGEVFFAQLGRKPLAQEPSLAAPELVLPLVLSALVYYLVNSALVAGVVALDCGGDMLLIWRTFFLRVSVLSWAGAAVGTLFAFWIRAVAPAVLLIVVPVLLLYYLANKAYLGPGAVAPIAADNDPVSQRAPYRRYHYLVVILGLGFIALLLLDVFKNKVSSEWLILALLAACAGLVTVRIPGIKIKVTLADTFVFANIILFGPVVGAITAALDGLSGSLRSKSKGRRWEYAFFNMAAMAISAFIAANIFFRLLGSGPLFREEGIRFGAIFLPVLLLAISHYLLNAFAVATIVALQEQLDILRVWRENLLWGLADYIACAFGAVFVAAAILAVTPATASAVLILLASLYLTRKSLAERISRRRVEENSK